MRIIPTSILVITAAVLFAPAASAGVAFPDPPGGWTYIYPGDQLLVGAAGDGYVNLDGTWTHDNGSDEWDGSEIGGLFDVTNRPGGASLGTQSGVKYLRMQDTGDPRDYDSAAGEFNDPGSNRKVYFGHNIGSDIDPVKAQTIMSDGLTLTFRARIPTLAKAGGPLDPLHRDGQQGSGIQPYPANGDGYVTSDGGKGNFVIREGGNGADVPAGAIAFSFTQTTDTTGGSPTANVANFAGLTFNEFNGNVPTANVNFGQGTKTNVVAFDPTEWHELYIVIRKDPANIGTHEAFIFVDGNLTPSVFKMTAGTGADMPDSFLAMGGSATPQNWALDVDWFGYKDDAVFPPGAQLPPSITDFVPVDRTMFHPIASGLGFTASVRRPGNTLPASGFKVTLNGEDVSGLLLVSGSDTSSSRSVTYNSLLQANSLYTATYIVTDSGGLSTTNDLSFDTFVEAQATIVEAEDYNFTSGQFLDNPAPGIYAGMSGTPGVDFVDTTPLSLGVYRPADAVDTATTADLARTKFVDAGQPDYQIATIGAGEWWNYTFTATGQYIPWVRVASTAAQEVRLDRVTGAITQPSQTVQFLGTFKVPRTGNLNVFGYAPLTDLQGRPIDFPLGGQTTLRLTAPNANNNLALNFLLLAPPATTRTDPLVAATPSADAVGVRADAVVEAAIYDASSPVDKATVKLRVDGTEVNATVDKTGRITQVKYAPAVMWAANSVHTVNLSFNDVTARSFDWGFTMAAYLSLTPSMKVTDARTPGFVWRMFQNEANQDNTIQRAEDALAGRLQDGSGQPLPNLANPDVIGPASGPGTPANPGNGTMTFNIPSVINVSQAEGTAFGNFTPDEQMPGIPGLSGLTDGIAAEIMAFIELPRGLVTMVVNSVDGFRTTAGFLKDNPLVLGEFNAGRGAADTLFQFAVQEAGTYAFRTVWEEGGGDASIEWFIVNADGSRVLINDVANGGPKAFQEGTVPNRPIENVVLTIRLNAAGQVVIEWPAGTLQSADAVSGTYQDVAGAQSPHVTAPSGTQKFYRVRVQ
ncbi:MAG: hypothetical protein HY674_21655 [Chloroflexi bacterium]|nr:hypothetical protein [Chloroflexota bacterium]